MIRILKWVGFVASGIISYMLMITLCKIWFDYVLAFAMTIVLQASSFYFFDKAIKEKAHWSKAFSSTLAILLFLISIIGTISFQFGIQNNIQNENIINSDAYRIAQENRNIKQNAVSAKEKQIEEAKVNLNAQINSIDESISEYRRLEKAQNQLYTTRIAKLNKEKNKLRAEFSDKIQILNNQLIDLSNKASEDFVINTDVKMSATKGYLPLMEAFSEWLGIDIKILTLIFQSFIACVFECTAIFLHIEDVKQTKPNPIKKPVTLTKAELPRVKPNPTKAPAIGFKLTNAMPSEADINKYIKHMENPNQKGICRGYKKISELTGIKQEECRTIKGILERKGMIETIGTKTKIIG
jgi:hypothetical protein